MRVFLSRQLGRWRRDLLPGRSEMSMIRRLLVVFAASLFAVVVGQASGLGTALEATTEPGVASVITSPSPLDCVEEDSAEAQLISVEPMPCSRMLVIGRWAANYRYQRRERAGFSFGEVRRVLRGDVLDCPSWAEASNVYVTVILSTRRQARSVRAWYPVMRASGDLVTLRITDRASGKHSPGLSRLMSRTA